MPAFGLPGEVEFVRQPFPTEVKHEQGINKISGRAAGILLLKSSQTNEYCNLELDNICECLRGFIQLLFFMVLRGLHETAASNGTWRGLGDDFRTFTLS